MPLFGSRRTHTVGTTTTSSRRRGGGLFHRRDKDRVAGGYKAALSNPNTTRSGRKHAKHELRAMGRGRETHVPFMTKVKRALGIRSTPRNTRRTRY
ncbi:hypothetical protein D9619_000866 [Psilocybe cf. subviscida]|uniref:Uncharacterized protein n=1 Tax=Psilocybe cf. subviscida TaxID=2480587 RepID=A0A8H5BDS4_9AGAR|nr:hypothetical protein D9619_000866 [Psilocybe cf. subviscida]